MPGAVYQETYSIETVRTILRTDRVYKMLYQGTPHILHLEFQIRAEKDMAARLLEYHAVSGTIFPGVERVHGAFVGSSS